MCDVKIIKIIDPDKTDLGKFLKKYKDRYAYNLGQAEEISADIVATGSLNLGLIRRIALWKIDRTIEISDELLQVIAETRSWTHQDFFCTTRHDEAFKQIVADLVKCIGVGLPMASTILRFINPSVFQIIDRRAFRVIYGREFTEPTPANVHNVYLAYLRFLCVFASKTQPSICYQDLDQVFYELDKDFNIGIKLGAGLSAK